MKITGDDMLTKKVVADRNGHTWREPEAEQHAYMKMKMKWGWRIEVV